MSLLKIADLLEQIVQELRSDQSRIDDDSSPLRDKTVILVPPPKEAPPVEAPPVEAPPVETPTVELKDLQRMGKSLINDGRADALKAMLASMGLKSLSSAPENRYVELYGNLNNL